MVSVNKYQAQKTIVDGIRFDSRFEARIYNTLDYYFKRENVYAHIPMHLFPPTTLYPKGKQWKIDFRVAINNNVLNVEAKGRLTLETYWQLTALEALQPAEFRKFVMIFNNADCFENTMLKRLANNRVNFAGMSFPQVMTYAQLLEILQG